MSQKDVIATTQLRIERNICNHIQGASQFAVIANFRLENVF